MPKTKDTVVSDTPIETTPETPDYSDVKGKDFTEVATTASEKDDKVAEEATKVEEPKVEDKVEEKKDEIVTPTPTIDAEALAKDISDKATKNIVTSLVGEEATAEEKDAVTVLVEKFEKDNGRLPDWKELAGMVKNTTKQEILDELRREGEEEQKRQTDETAQTEKATTEFKDSLNKVWDDDIASLEQAGKLPPVKDKNDPNDPGVKAHLELFSIIQKSNEERAAQGLAPNYSLKLAFYEGGYKGPEAQPAGADAPVDRGNSSGTSGGEVLDYASIKGKDFLEIATPKTS